MADDNNDDYQKPGKSGKQHNILTIWGNEQTMNLNPLILTNIQGSSYFKVHLFKLKTYHEVVDEIYYQVKHLEPWERGSRKTAGQTGMCGGVRGVGAGGIVSTAYCLLYKLYTLRLTRKQVVGLMNHTDSPFIRALGFMYLRYTQPPSELFDWYVDYLEDEEEVDPKAGGGQPTTMGALARQLLVKLDWFSTLFPRIPVPMQKSIEQRLAEHDRETQRYVPKPSPAAWTNNYSDSASTANDRGRDRDRNIDRDRDRDKPNFGEAERYSRDRNSRSHRDSDREKRRGDERSERDHRGHDRDRNRSDRDKYRSRSRDRRHR